MKIVALVPIKLNSERVPNKNILTLGKHPMCYHLVNTLLKVNKIDEVCIYCSDEQVMEYLPVGAVFKKRRKELDGNLVKGEEIYSSFLREVDADIYILAHTTSPFTKVESVEHALEKVLYDKYDSAFSAQKVQTFSWYRQNPINYELNHIPRTQEIEPIYIETSSFYIFFKELWEKYRRRIGFCPYIQEVDAIEAVEIDTMDQFMLAKSIAESELAKK